MQLFYAPDITDEMEYLLSQEESDHCIGVLRFRKGQSIDITDGRGFFYKASIEGIAKKQVIVSIISKRSIVSERRYHLHIAIAPTKSIERFGWFIEKAVEIGIDEITPLLTENSERKIVRIDRLEKIAIAAMKQSLKAYLPKINSFVTYSDFLEINHQEFQEFIAHCGKNNRVLLQRAYVPGNNALILIGPEGDFTPGEIEKAIKNGYSSVSLGNSRLRTETSGIAACHTIYVVNQK
jgi:16S rRNA (uracil1498-N3)-methyltransferase